MAKTKDEEVEVVDKKAAKADDKPIESKIKAGGHVKPADMRKEVSGVPLEDLSADPDSVRAPYPQGSPRSEEDIFEEVHGFKKGA